MGGRLQSGAGWKETARLESRGREPGVHGEHRHGGKVTAAANESTHLRQLVNLDQRFAGGAADT